MQHANADKHRHARSVLPCEGLATCHVRDDLQREEREDEQQAVQRTVPNDGAARIRPTVAWMPPRSRSRARTASA